VPVNGAQFNEYCKNFINKQVAEKTYTGDYTIIVRFAANSDERNFKESMPYQQFIKDNGWERFGRKVAEYAMMGLEERMVGLLMLSPEDRYLQLLGSNKKKIIERIPQHHIANYLGITPVSLSRIRNRISKKDQ